MIWVALKSLAERRVRAALTALAVVLGVAMIAGSLIVTDTIDRAFTGIFDSSYTQTDLVVRGSSAVEGSRTGAPTVPADLVERIRDVPGVTAASGSIVDLLGSGSTARLIGRDGEPIGGDGPSLGFGIDPSQERFNPLNLTEGAWASGPDQVVIDVHTAESNDIAVGDTVDVAAAGPARTFTVTGLARFGDTESLGGATIAAFDIPTAREVLGTTGFQTIQIATDPGVAAADVARRIEDVLPPATEVRTGAEQAAADKAEISEAIGFIRGFLLAFGGIALFVGAFVIFNTLAITVAQRSRELATLRTLGASRRQVLRSVIVEALAIGFAASLVGLAAGIGLAKGLAALFRAMGAGMPEGGTVVAPGTIVISLLAGTLVTVLAGLVPAVRATRVPPIAAVREGAVAEPGRMSRLAPVIALATIVVATALLAWGGLSAGLSGADRALGLGVGGLALFAGVGMISSRLVRPLASVVGWPVARLRGAPGELARENAVRNPARTASTAAALMIGLALVTFVAVVGAGLLGSATSAVEDQFRSEYVVSSPDTFGPIPTAVGRHIAGADGVTASTAIRLDQAVVDGSQESVSGVDPATIGALYSVPWSEGSTATFATLEGDGALISDDLAEEHGLSVGSPVTLTTGDGTVLRRTVTGLYDPNGLAPLVGAVVISQRAFDGAFPHPADQYVLVDGDRAGLDAALAGFPDTTVETASGFADLYGSDVSMILNLLYVLLALSVVVSLIGMVNTLVLAMHERTRELGMLRAVGMSRRQIRAMVRGESVVTALIGAALGLPLGIGLAALVVHSMSGLGVGMVLPVGSLVAFVVVAIVAGVVAAVLPARRAARLDVLRALQYE